MHRYVSLPQAECVGWVHGSETGAVVVCPSGCPTAVLLVGTAVALWLAKIGGRRGVKQCAGLQYS